MTYVSEAAILITGLYLTGKLAGLERNRIKAVTQKQRHLNEPVVVLRWHLYYRTNIDKICLEERRTEPSPK
jgi:hypothetical protein